MRDVGAPPGMPTREEVRARIEDPERFRPEPVLARPVERRVASDGGVEMLFGKAWTKVPDAVVELHDALEDGATFAQIVERAYAKAPRKLPALFEHFVRDHLWDLHTWGNVRIPLEEPPGVFRGRYERIRELGRGGMGVAHLCRDRETGRDVVVKHAWGWNIPIERAEYTNRREALVMAQLDHPGIPQVVDRFEERGILHLVREFADGPTLSSGATKRALHQGPAARRLRIGARVTDILQHLHERGYLYLDCKPSNLILVDDERVLLLDLGVARRHENGEAKLGSRVGSPGYAAPEVRLAKRASLHSDQYGLGCVLFTLAVGSRPSRSWGERGIEDAMRAHGLPDAERRVIARMTAWRPEGRYPTLANAVDAMLAAAKDPACERVAAVAPEGAA